jgi:hypothetical protein
MDKMKRKDRGTKVNNENGNTKKRTYRRLLNDHDIKNWNENISAGSSITGEVYLRTLGLYCKLNNTNPKKIIEDSKEGRLKRDFMDFVRKLEGEGKAGSYIVRFKKVLSSWVRFNDINIDLKSVKVMGASRSPRVENERVPTQEELSKLLAAASPRARVSISLLAFSGMRIETIGNHKGDDGLVVGDFPELKISDGKIEFEKLPTVVKVRPNLSKTRHQYITFLTKEGANYLKAYLEGRMENGEVLDYKSPLIIPERPLIGNHERVRTTFVSREIKNAMKRLNFNWRPYVLRAYFSTALDVCENRGLVSHNWREFWHGHTGDISARYSTNKRLGDDIVEQMRETYLKCAPYLETGRRPLSEEEKDQLNRDVKKWYLTAMGFTDEEIEKENMLELQPEDLQKKVRDKLNMATNNGHSQKVIPMRDVKHYIEDLGWEFVKDIENKEAIVRLPER